MKKEYLMPAIKTMRMAEPLMDAVVSDTYLDPEEFEEGAKDMDLDDFSPVFTNKSVWND